MYINTDLYFWCSRWHTASHADESSKWLHSLHSIVLAPSNMTDKELQLLTETDMGHTTDATLTNISYNIWFLQSFSFCVMLQDTAAERAKKIFGELDVNGDGELTSDEFVKGCLEDSDLIRSHFINQFRHFCPRKLVCFRKNNISFWLVKGISFSKFTCLKMSLWKCNQNHKQF